MLTSMVLSFDHIMKQSSKEQKNIGSVQSNELSLDYGNYLPNICFQFFIEQGLQIQGRDWHSDLPVWQRNATFQQDNKFLYFELVELNLYDMTNIFKINNADIPVGQCLCRSWHRRQTLRRGSWSPEPCWCSAFPHVAAQGSWFWGGVAS